MWALQVELLTGRFVATAYNSRRSSEWPPHPARLYSALVATHCEAPTKCPEEQAALLWLERQAPPSIRASDASERDVGTVFVPVNDASVVGSFDKQEAAVTAARSAVSVATESHDAKALAKARRALEKAEAALAAAAARATARPSKKTKGGAAAAVRVLPDGRSRQPRAFPSVTPEDPTVTYIWDDASPSPEVRRALEGLVGRLVRLGHSSSLVAARVVDAPGDAVWRPAPVGELTLRTVKEGQLDALERARHLHRETEPRVMPAVFQPYTRSSEDSAEPAIAGVFEEEWLVLRRVGGPSFPMAATVAVAAAVRGALLRYAEEPVASVLSGHGAGGGPAQEDHLAIVPLPFVGHARATGSILGVALVLPRATPVEARRAVFRAVRAWEDASRQEDEDTPALPIRLGRAGVLEVERVEWAPVPATLRPETWTAPARVWLSATPVALDRNPGDLRSRDRDAGAKALAQAGAIVASACVRVGLPEPVAVEILPAAPWAGADKARRFPRFPENPAKLQRVLTHIRVEFAVPVRGPLLLGAGRYLGLGLMRPEAGP